MLTWTERGIYIFLPQNVQVLLWSEVKGNYIFLPYVLFNLMLVEDLIVVGGFSCSVRSGKIDEVTFLLKIDIIDVSHCKVLNKHTFVNLCSIM